MAISKKTFTGTTLEAQSAEMLAWLTENAAEYFDSITADSSGNISCKIGGDPALDLGFSGSVPLYTVYLQNGVSISPVTLASKGGLYSLAVATSCGIYFRNLYGYIFVTRSNTGSIAFVMQFRSGNDTTSNYLSLIHI